MPRLPICNPLLDIAGDFDPMNLVNPFFIGSGTDPDALDFFARVAAVGDGDLDATGKAAIDDYCKGTKSDSIWTTQLDIGPLVGPSLACSLVKLKKLSSGWSYTNNNFVGGDYSQVTGLTGNGSNAFLQSGVIGYDMTTDSSGIGVYNRATANSTGCENGCRTATGSTFSLYAPFSDNTPYSDQYNEANEIGGSAISGAIGFLFATRPSSSSHVLYRNGSSVASSGTVGGLLPPDEITFFKVNFRTVYTSHPLAFLALTLGMDATQAAALNTRVQALQTALGRNV